MEEMTAKEVLRLIKWLENEGYNNDKIVECIKAVESSDNDSDIKND